MLLTRRHHADRNDSSLGDGIWIYRNIFVARAGDYRGTDTGRRGARISRGILFTKVKCSSFYTGCGISRQRVRYHIKLWVGTHRRHLSLFKFGHAVRITRDKVSHVHTWYDRVGKWGLLFGFYLLGVRHLIGFGAGIAKLPVSVFALLAFAGAFMWSVTFVTAGTFSVDNGLWYSARFALRL